MNEMEILKIRRFSLFSSALLLFYVSTGMGLKNNELNILNNTFNFDKQWLIPFLIAGFTLYGVMRFIYYGIVASHHPIRARKELREGKVPVDGWEIEYNKSGSSETEYNIKRKQMKIQQAAKFFPRIEVTQNGDVPDKIEPKTKILYYLIYDIDYYAPIWVGGFSIIYFLISYFC